MGKQEDAAKHYKQKQIESATPAQLILLLYEGAIERLNSAEAALDEKGPQRIEKYHNNLITCQDIITELIASLDMEKGGEIAENLFRLYDFMHYRLVDANMVKDKKPIQEVRKLLVDLKETWKEVIAKEPQISNTTPKKDSGLNLQG